MRPCKEKTIRSALLAAAVCATVPIAHADVADTTLTHHDWTISCDNTRTCRAAGYQSRLGGDKAVSLLLTRKAGPGTPVEAKVRLGQTVDEEKVDALSLEVLGEDLGALVLDREEGIAVLSQEQAYAVARALTGVPLIRFVGSKPDQRWEVSDTGANGVLLKMDEFQGRLDTPGALVRSGNANEAYVLPPLPVPVLRIAPQTATRPEDRRLAESAELRNALIQSLGDEECGGVMPGDDADALEVERLSETKLLVSTRCWRGPYNWGFGFWSVEDTAPFKAELVTVSGGHYSAGVIEAHQKGGGAGDCVWSASWIWGGAGFVLARESTTGLCRGVAMGGAWDMPTVVTEVVR